jgi:hypothetical protein
MTSDAPLLFVTGTPPEPEKSTPTPVTAKRARADGKLDPAQALSRRSRAGNHSAITFEVILYIRRIFTWVPVD